MLLGNVERSSQNVWTKLSKSFFYVSSPDIFWLAAVSSVSDYCATFAILDDFSFKFVCGRYINILPNLMDIEPKIALRSAWLRSSLLCAAQQYWQFWNCFKPKHVCIAIWLYWSVQRQHQHFEVSVRVLIFSHIFMDSILETNMIQGKKWWLCIWRIAKRAIYISFEALPSVPFDSFVFAWFVRFTSAILPHAKKCCLDFGFKHISIFHFCVHFIRRLSPLFFLLIFNGRR